MDLKKRLSSHPVNTLKKEISKTNVKGYSKMKKEAVIALMMKTPERFNHIKENVKVSKEEKTKARVTSILKKQEPATKGNFEKIKVKGKEYFIDTTTNKLYDIDSKKLVGSIVKGEVIMKDKKIIKKAAPAAAPAAAAAAEPVKKKKIIKAAPAAAPAVAAAPAAAEPVKKKKIIKKAPAATAEASDEINPNAHKIQKEALKLLDDNKTFFEKIPVFKGHGDKKTIDTNTNYYKEQKHNLINRTTHGSDKDATRRATFYLNKLTDRLKNKTAEEPAAAAAAAPVKKKKIIKKAT